MVTDFINELFVCIYFFSQRFHWPDYCSSDHILCGCGPNHDFVYRPLYIHFMVRYQQFVSPVLDIVCVFIRTSLGIYSDYLCLVAL